MTTPIKLTLAVLFGVSFAASLWLSGGLQARAPVQLQPELPLASLVMKNVATSEQPMRDWSALVTPAEEAPLREDLPPTLSQLTTDPDPDTRSEAQTLMALLNEEVADHP